MRRIFSLVLGLTLFAAIIGIGLWLGLTGGTADGIPGNPWF